MTKRNSLEITNTYELKGKESETTASGSFWLLQCEKTKNVGLYNVERWGIVN